MTLGTGAKIISIILTLVICLICSLSIRKTYLLKKRLIKSIVLIPLYKPKYNIIITIIIFLALLVISIIGAITMEKVKLIFACLSVSISFIIGLLIHLITLRFAVTDTGIMIPYKFIDWIEFCDYGIDDNKVYFTGDKNGFYSLTSTSSKLAFNMTDINKLEIILDRHKR